MFKKFNFAGFFPYSELKFLMHFQKLVLYFLLGLTSYLFSQANPPVYQLLFKPVDKQVHLLHILEQRVQLVLLSLLQSDPSSLGVKI